MDNLTHSLVGLTAAKAGLERLSGGATTLCILAANAPDVDIVALIFGGRWVFLQHHRGITHSIVGSAALGIGLPIVFYLGDHLVARLRNSERRVKLGGLLIASLLTIATHPFLDWTNNYGMRFFLPWNPKWSYGDFLFVIDPFFWMVLGGAAFLLTSKTRKQVFTWLVIALVPSYLVLVRPAGDNRLANVTVLRLLWIIALIVLITLYHREVGRRRGAQIAIAALVTISIYCTALALTHLVAFHRAKLQAAGIAQNHAEQVLKIAAMPTVANPTEWLCVLETDRASYRFNLSLLPTLSGSSNVTRFEKPTGVTAEMVAQAERDARAQVFLGFARFPGVRVAGEDCATQTLVQFADLRYTEPGKERGTFSLEVPVDCPVLDRLDR